MKMRNRKIIAIVCAIALVIGSFATYTATTNRVKADTDPYASETWKSATDGSDYKVCIVGQTTTNEFSGAVQVEGSTLYLAASAAIIKPNYVSVTLNGTAMDTWAGAYFRFDLADLGTDRDNTVVVKDAVGGNYTMIVRSGDPYGGETASQTESQSSDGWTKMASSGNIDLTNGWRYFAGGAGGTMPSAYYKENGSSLSVKVETPPSAEWGLQLWAPQTVLTTGTTYQYQISFTADKAGTLNTKDDVSGSAWKPQSYVAGDNTLTGEFTAAANTRAFIANMVGVAANTTFTDITVTYSSNYTTQATTTAPDETDAQGYTKVQDPSQWITHGNFQLYQSSGTRTVWYKGAGTYSDMKVKLVGANPGQWQSQIGINVAGLTSGTEYDYSIVFDSNQAGVLYTQVPGVVQSESINISSGSNTISGSFTAGTDPAHGQLMLFPEGMGDGTILDFTSVTVAPHGQLPTTTAPEVQNITVVPRTATIQEYNNIWADWTNPTGTSKTYVYLDSVTDGHSACTPGWDFNTQAQQPMASVDNVSRTRDNSIFVTPGNTYTLIVEAFNDQNQKIGRGSVSITMPRAELQIEFTDTYRQEVVKDGTTYYALFANWRAVPGATRYKSYINELDDDHSCKAVTNGWVWNDVDGGAGSTDLKVDNVALTKDNTVLNNNTTYTLIVIAYDNSGNEVARNSVALEGKPGMDELDYTATNNADIPDPSNPGSTIRLPISYAIYDAESSYLMRNEAANWVDRPQTHDYRYAKVAWGAGSLLNNAEKVILNGTEYTSSGGPIFEFVGTMLQIYTDVGFNIGYNKVKVVKGDEFVTIVFRVGGATDPDSVIAYEQSGVPGSILVSWVPGAGTPTEQVFRIYVDGDMKKGNILTNNAVLNNIDAGTHTVKVVGYYADTESSGTTASVTVSKGVKYNSDISIEGFQIKSNYPGTPPENVSFRTMCKAPKAGSTIKASGKNYTVKKFGTIYAIDTNTREYKGTNVLDASYTLLNETRETGEQYQYTGYRTYQGDNRTYGYVASDDAIITDYKSGDTDNTYYAFTMDGMTKRMAYTIWVRPFVETEEGDLVYGKTTAYTSVAEIANKLYKNSMCKNATAHDYLFTKILSTNTLRDADNPYWRDPSDEHSRITYGWNNNLYIGFRKVPDSWNGTQNDEGQYVTIGDWRVHNTSHFGAAASYKGNSNDEMMVRVDNPGYEVDTDGLFPWNWGIQLKLANTIAYSRLEDGRYYKMTLTYNSTKAGIMRVKTEGNSASSTDDGYYTTGHDIVYDFDAVAGGNAHSITFKYEKNKYVNNPGAIPSIVLCLGAFKVYPFEQGPSTERPHDSRSELCIDYYDVNNYKPDSEKQHQVGDIGGFPTGTIISDVDIVFTEVDSH